MANKPAEFQHYPKWVNGVVVENQDEEDAVLEDRAIYQDLNSAQGVTRRIVGIEPKKKGKK